MHDYYLLTYTFPFLSFPLLSFPLNFFIPFPQERIESQATEIVQLRAQQSVLLGEKEKQQRMWETAMNDHFTSFHEKERSHTGLQKDHDKLRDEKAATERRLRTKLEEYKTLLQQMQTYDPSVSNVVGVIFDSKTVLAHVVLFGAPKTDDD